MRVGILADIHESNARLRAAIRGLNALGVDRLLFLGDLFETGEQVRESWEILRSENVQGVWGNHELGLCLDPSRRLREKYADVLEDFANLKPFLVVEDVRFSHAAPWIDATNGADFYLVRGSCDPEVFVERSAQFAERVFLIGHHHRWRAVSDTVDLSTWQGRSPLDLSVTGRTLINVHAVMDGWCGLLDTTANLFEPIAIDG